MMKQYSEYKDSGVKWIGDIPSHWEVKSLRAYIRIYSEKNHAEKPLLSVTREEGVILRNIDSKEENHNFIPDDLSGYKLVQKGDFVINKMKSWQGSYGVSNYEGIVSPAYYICKLEFENKDFFSKSIRCKAYIPFFNQYSKGIRVDQWDLSPIALKNIPFFVPPLPEQQAIVSYLDAKVAKIDSYIATATKKIAALDELKQVTIANAVTKGINPNAPMKDSGIPWIGMVPENWDTDKIRKHFKERRTKVSDKDYSPLSVAKAGIVPQLEDACKTDNGDNRKLVLKGDFVVNSRSDRKGSCGVSYLDGSVSLINIVLEVINMDKRYIHNLFRCFPYIEEFYRNGRGIVADLWTTRYSEMKNIFIPVPPLTEQTEIVAYIDRKVAQIDQMRAAELSQIEKLKEYKQRLISDVVTGKVKVTND